MEFDAARDRYYAARKAASDSPDSNEAEAARRQTRSEYSEAVKIYTAAVMQSTEQYASEAMPRDGFKK